MPRAPTVTTRLATLANAHATRLAVAITLLGVALRWTGELFYWINPDEGINYWIAAQPTLSAGWRELTAHSHPPVISILIRCMLWFGDDPAWIRMLSFAAGGGAVFATFLAGREWLGNGAGLLAALLVAVSPAAIEQSHVIRPYMLQLVFLALSAYFAGRWLRERGGLVGLAICTALAIGSQYSSLYAVGGLGLVLAGTALRQRAGRRLLGVVAAFVAPVAVAVLLYVFHLRSLMRSTMAAAAKDSWLSSQLPEDLVQLARNFVGLHGYLFGEWLAGAAALATLAALVHGLVRRAPGAVLVTGTCGLAMFAAMLHYYPFGNTRHSIHLLPLVALALAGGGAALARAPTGVVIGAGVVLLGMIPATGPVQRLLGSERLPTPIPEVTMPAADIERIRAVLGQLSAADNLVLTDAESFYTLYPEFRRRWAEPPVQVTSGRVFRIGSSRFVCQYAWSFAFADHDFVRLGHPYTLLDYLTSQHPDLGIRSRAACYFLLGTWPGTSSSFDRVLESDAEAAQAVRQKTTTRGVRGYEIDLPAFSRYYGQRLAAAMRAGKVK